jgi:hypothetical protein
MNFDMNRTWSQAVALVRANFQLLAVVAGVFLLLPALAFYLFNPDLLEVFVGGRTVEQIDATIAAMVPRLLGFGLVVFICQIIGQAALVALVGQHRPTVGEAIGLGARALPSLVGALIVFFIAMYAIGLVVSLIVALAALLFGAAVIAGGALAGLISIALLLVQLYLMVRCMMALPVIVLEHQRNPWKALVRSWRLTAGHAWRILAFVILLGVAYFVIVLLVMFVLGAIGLIAGADSSGQGIGTGSVLGFAAIASVMGAAVAMLASGVLVSMHRQLAGGGEPDDVEFDA